MGIKNTERCEVCGVTDYVEHLFFECHRIGSFWQKVESFVKIKLDKNISLTKRSVLLGIEQDAHINNLSKNEIHQINEIIIIAKLSISKSKVRNTNIEVTFENELRIRKKLENIP